MRKVPRSEDVRPCGEPHSVGSVGGTRAIKSTMGSKNRAKRAGRRKAPIGRSNPPTRGGGGSPPRGAARQGPEARGTRRSSEFGGETALAPPPILLDPILTVDDHGVIRFASDSVERVFGWNPAELLGRNVGVLIPETHRSSHDEYLERYRSTGRASVLDQPRHLRGVRRNGEEFDLELWVTRVDLPAPDAPMFVAIIRDIGEHDLSVSAADRSGPAYTEERRRLHYLLAEQTAALQTVHLRLRISDRMASIGTLAAGLGHDMSNMLLPVKAKLNALRAAGAKGKLPVDQRRHIEDIIKSIAYLQQMADGLHYLTVDPEREDVAHASSSIGRWWSQTGRLLIKAVPRHVKVTADIAPDLPDVAISMHSLTQAVLNLIVNAGEAIPARRLRPRGVVGISAELAGDGRAVRIGVRDNGCGMSEEVRRRAFEIFFTTKPRGLGSGMGLPLVRRVADRAGGTVEIDSAPGKGTTVVMVIPVAHGDGSPQAQALRAVVSMPDGRAAAVIHHLFERAGITSRSAEEPADADIWATEPSRTALATARAWRKRAPTGRILLLGHPATSSWRAWEQFGAICIDDAHDLGKVGEAIGRLVRH